MKTTILMLLLFFSMAVFSQETVTIGNQIWTKQNLNVGTMIPISQAQTNNDVLEKYCYKNIEANCTTYGGWYQWDELMQYSTTPGVQGICPTGFHVPTYGEFMEMINFLGGIETAGNELKETGTAHWIKVYPQWTPTNSSEFTLLGNGSVITPSRSMGMKVSSYLWTSTKLPSNHFLPEYSDVTPYPVQVTSTYNNSWANPATMYPFVANGVRCLKN